MELLGPSSSDLASSLLAIINTLVLHYVLYRLEIEAEIEYSEASVQIHLCIKTVKISNSVNYILIRFNAPSFVKCSPLVAP